MEFITIQEVEKMAKPGDKLQGILYQYPGGLPANKVRVNEIVFWDCIGCLTGKSDVVDGADYYLQKQEDGSFRKYGITRVVNGCMKVPKEFIEHLVNKYSQLEEESKISTSDKWEDWELVNCYYEQEPIKVVAKPRYCCCYNSAADTYVEEFNTLTAVWAYLNTDMDIVHCISLDNITLTKEAHIKILEYHNERYKKEVSMMKKELTMKERSLLKSILKEHQLEAKELMGTASKKDAQSLKKEYDRVDDIIHKLGL